MKFKPDTENILLFLDIVTGNNLNKRTDLGYLLEIAAESNQPKLMNQIIFTGSYLNKLTRTKENEDTVGSDILLAEIESAKNELASHIQVLLSETSLELTDFFYKNYFKQGSCSVRGLFDLAEDLAVIKMVQNTMKYKKEQKGETS